MYFFYGQTATALYTYGSKQNPIPNPYAFTEKIVLSPDGDNGALFGVNSDETCYLTVDFDYLVLFDCDTLMRCGDKALESDFLSTDLYSCLYSGRTAYSTGDKYFYDLVKLYNPINGTIPYNGINIPNYSKSDITVTSTDYVDYVTSYTRFNSCWSNWQTAYKSSFLPELTVECKSDIDLRVSIINNNLTTINTLNNLIFNPKTTYYMDVDTGFRLYDITSFHQEVCAQISTLRQEINDTLVAIIDIFHVCARETTYDHCDIISVLSGIQLDTTIEYVENTVNTPPIYFESPTKLTTASVGTFFRIQPDFISFFHNNFNTGIMLTGNCNSVLNCIKNDLGAQCDVISASSFNSAWVHYSATISDTAILDLIKNKKIKLGFQINNCFCDFSLLIDNIQLNKVCKVVEISKQIVNTSPGFNLTRYVDNKKSWIKNETPVKHEYDLSLRDTSYNLNHSKLLINTKEVDINLDGSSAIECNVYDYIVNNDCLLEPIIYENELLSTPMSTINTAEEFNSVITTELIDVKSRKVMSAYPTLRYIYDIYNDPYYVGCTTPSRGYNYCMLTKFIHLIGTYWVDMIEQLIPATTIWGSTNTYRNTIYDQGKFKYKRGSLNYCHSKSGCEGDLENWVILNDCITEILNKFY